jgi:RNA polymerase sigma-70 factor (ECF subfamily)
MPAHSRSASNCSTSVAHCAVAIRRLTECRSEFLRFFRRRLSRLEDADDAFQDFCLKVIRAAQAPDDDGRVDAWLRLVRRNTLTDHYRRRAARHRAEAAYEAETPEPMVHPGADQPDDPCRCARGLMPTLRPDYAEIIRRADLAEEPRERIAADLGLTLNNIGVRLHRARRALKAKIEERCAGRCDDSFRNCVCAPVAQGRVRSSTMSLDVMAP